MKKIFIVAFLLILAFMTPLFFESVSAFPPTTDPPVAPKTRNQIASEAYAIQSNALAISGRKAIVSCAGISIACPAGAAISTSNLVAAYDMETLNAGKLKDFSGNSHDCTENGGVSAGNSPGEFGRATGFDGTDDVMDCGSFGSAPASATWHFHLLSNVTTRIAASFDNAGNEYLYGIHATLGFYCADGGNAIGSPGTTGVWYSVDCVFNGSNLTLNIYVNGAWKASHAWGPGFSGSWAKVSLGAYTLNTLWFSGMIDEFSVWGRALTGTEINTLHSVGAPLCTGASPSDKGAATFTSNTIWDGVKYHLTALQRIELSVAHPSIMFQILNSCIDGGSLTNAFVVNDTTTSEIYAWDNITAVNLVVRNSTVKNFSTFVLHDNSGGNYRVGALVMTLDNVTITNFDTYSNTSHATERSFYNPIHDISLSDYNRADNSFCAFDQSAQSTTRGYEMYRVHSVESNSIVTGCIAGNDLRVAKNNYFQGGFLQIVFGSDFEHGVSPDFGSPTEFVNWSGNYANDSRHTVFGFYGTATGNFANHLGTNAYVSIYGNYVNNSRYIPIQSSGNVTGLRIIKNYVRGPIPWPGGTPTFEIAILVGEQNHGSIVDHNYLWDMDDEHIVGIDIGFAAYNNIVSNNVLYDIGSNHIRVEGTILKFKNSGDCAAGCSDYSWKGSNNTISNNYLAGGTHSAAVLLDSAGYTFFKSNAFVTAGTGMFLVRKSLSCDCAFTWADWIDGYPDTPTVSWSGTILSAEESHFWIRSIRTGTIQSTIPHPIWVNLTTDNPLHFGLLSTRCVDNGAATGGHTTTDAEVLAWSGHSCGQVADQKSYPFSGSGLESFTVQQPEQWFNKTLTLSFKPIYALVSAIGQFTVTTTNTGGSYLTNSNFVMDPGYSYIISNDEKITKFITNGALIFGFVAILTLGFVGALAIKRKRGH